MALQEVFQTLTEYGDRFFAQLFTKVIVAIIILLIGFIIGRIVAKIIQRFLHEIELNKILKKMGISASLEKGISNFAKYFIYFIAVIWALNEIGLTTTILNMISGAALILIIVSVLLAIKDFIPNIISGFLINQKSLIKKGDKISIDKLEGKVVDINLIETKIKTRKGDIIHIPNSTITKKELIVKKH